MSFQFFDVAAWHFEDMLLDQKKRKRKEKWKEFVNRAEVSKAAEVTEGQLRSCMRFKSFLTKLH